MAGCTGLINCGVLKRYPKLRVMHKVTPSSSIHTRSTTSYADAFKAVASPTSFDVFVESIVMRRFCGFTDPRHTVMDLSSRSPLPPTLGQDILEYPKVRLTNRIRDIGNPSILILYAHICRCIQGFPACISNFYEPPKSVVI